jgi:hypothetical protein
MEVAKMSKYEFSLRQEVLLEKGAATLADLFHYERAHGITDKANPVSVLYELVWLSKRNILVAQSETELAKIEGQFDLANSFLGKMGEPADVQ